MGSINTLTANRAIVDDTGRPLPEFLLLWQILAETVGTASVLSTYAQYEQQVDVGTLYAAGLAQVTADAALAGAPRSGLNLGFVTTTGASWVSSGVETLSTVSAGDLTILNTGPIQVTGTNGVSQGEFRVVEDPSGAATTVFTGTWRTDGDGATYGLVQNEALADTLSFSLASASTGTVDYGLEFRTMVGDDVTLLAYLFVRRS